VSAPHQALQDALAGRRILIVSGSGGVGKTTTAAALALRAALQGRRVLVCTIDPSRRLATSLGLESLSDRAREMDIRRFDPGEGGRMWAMTLDTKRTFDTLVERHTPDEAARRRILGNRFYGQISAALAGSHEYMAMEKLLDLAADERFDLVVLDTPPTRHALDFLEAPERLMGFLDTSVLRWLLKPYFVAGRLTLKVATRTGAFVLKLADRVLGLQFLQDLSEFFLAFEGMYAGFKERAAQVHEMLRRDDAGFVLVAGASEMTLDEALYFHRRLVEREMPFVGFIVNRLHPSAAPSAGRGPAPDIDDDLGDRLVEVFKDYRRLSKAEMRSVARLEDETGIAPVLVPELEGDVHDLDGLHEVGELLLGAAAAPPTRRRRTRARSVAATGRGAAR
jgi:anion-transporting  ArsA/GET3 family ATPase